MKLNFSRLFNLTLEHAYYENGVPRGLHLKPTQSAAKKLRSGRMLLKPLNKGITLLYETRSDGYTPKVGTDTPFDLYFALYHNDSGFFYNVTDFNLPDGESLSRGSLLLFAGEAGDGSAPQQLSAELLDGLRAERFTFAYTLDGDDTNRIFTLLDESGDPVSAGTNPQGEPLPEELLLSPDSGGRISTTINLAGRGGRVYTATVRREGETELIHSETFFADAALAARPPVALIRLRFAEFPEPEEKGQMPQAFEFALNFAARTTYWRYYVINRSGKVIHSGGNLDQLAVLPSESSDLPDGTQFPRLSPPPDADFSIDGFSTAAFRSSDALPFRERAYTGLRLLNDDHELIRHMPNPGSSVTIKQYGDSHETETYIYL